MKAVVVEIRGAKAAVLMDDGQIKLLTNRNYEKGQVIYVSSTSLASLRAKTKLWSALTAAVLVLVLGVSSYAYFTPVSTVSLDVNPSLEFNLNRFEKVLSVHAYGEAGQQIINQLQLKNKSIDEAIMLALQQMSQEGYLGVGEENGIMISAAFKNSGQEQSLVARLKARVEGELEDLELEAEVEAIGVGYERVLAARLLDMTPGKLNLLERLQASAELDTEDYEISEWRDSSVKEIMQEINANRMKAKGVPVGPGAQGIKNEDEADSDDLDPDAGKGGKPENLPGKGNSPDKGKGN